LLSLAYYFVFLVEERIIYCHIVGRQNAMDALPEQGMPYLVVGAGGFGIICIFPWEIIQCHATHHQAPSDSARSIASAPSDARQHQNFY
jgi:hypothetical protein